MFASEESPWSEPLLPFERKIMRSRSLTKGFVDHTRSGRDKTQVDVCARLGVRCGVNAMNCTNCAAAHGVIAPKRRN